MIQYIRVLDSGPETLKFSVGDFSTFSAGVSDSAVDADLVAIRINLTDSKSAAEIERSTVTAFDRVNTAKTKRRYQKKENRKSKSNFKKCFEKYSKTK